MPSFDEEFKFEFICLCCGARNGEVREACSVNKFPLDPATDINSLQPSVRHAYLDLLAWLESPDYKGSLLVPVGFEVTEENRLLLLRATEPHRAKRPRGIMLFKLPIIKEKIQGIIDIRDFLN